MDFFQKEAAGRDRVTEAARRWTAAQGEPDQGFAEWYGSTG